MENRNPWLSIWTEPRATIAGVIQQNPNRCLWVLAAIYGFCAMMNLSQSIALGNAVEPIGIIILSALLAPFYGYINFSIWSFFVTFVGKWFKGQGDFKTIRAAYAWSCVPMTFTVPLWLLMAILFGHQLFLNFPDAALFTNSQITTLFLILIAKVVLAIWSLVIYINALAEVQKFSILRSIVNIIVAGVLFSIIICILWSLLLYAMGDVAVSAYTILKPF
jgi:hypothetical protein